MYRVVVCRGGSRYVEGVLGFLVFGFWFLGVEGVIGFLVFGFWFLGFLVSWSLSFLVSKFYGFVAFGFLVSKFQGLTKQTHFVLFGRS